MNRKFSLKRKFIHIAKLRFGILCGYVCLLFIANLFFHSASPTQEVPGIIGFAIGWMAIFI